ncbi:MAG: LytR/AlgR family response regulator transcription factor [Sphingobacterium sp.]
MLNCIVIDDEDFARENIARDIQKISDLNLVGVFENAFEAMSLVESGEVDLVFCDIQMPELTGISFLKSLMKPPLFVFITGDPSYAVESFELNVIDYILKPYNLGRLIKSVTKARAYLASVNAPKEEKTFLIIKDRSSNIIMPYNEIHYIKSDRDYVDIFTLENKYTIWKRLSELVETLSGAKQFLRIQKSYIINLEYAKTIEGNHIKMKGNLPDIPIGGQYKPELFRRLGIQG